MEILQKKLSNKEAQFREMSAQLVSHLSKINSLTEMMEKLRNENEDLQNKIFEKDTELNELLKRKAELLDILQALEFPSLPQNDANNKEIKEKEIIDDGIENSEFNDANLYSDDKQEKMLGPEEEEEIKESYISDEIDITAELEKLGVVELVKKY